MTDGDRRFPDLLRQAREEFSRRLAEAGTPRPPEPAEDAVLVAAATMVDSLHARLSGLAEALRPGLLELLGLTPAGPVAARAELLFRFDPAPDAGFEIPAGTEVTTVAGEPVFRTLAPVRVTGSEATVLAAHGRWVRDEPLGVSDGTAGQVFRLRHPPAGVAGAEPVVEVGTERGWERCPVRITAAGEVRFPAEGAGAVPPEGAIVRAGYWTGGGSAGNVAAGSLGVLRTRLPGVRVTVHHPAPAGGGRDAESTDDLWRRVPRLISGRDRAVTGADFERLARAAHPAVARAHCLPEPERAAVRVLLVAGPPAAVRSRPTVSDVTPSPETLAAVAARLEPHRPLAVGLHVSVPLFRQVTVSAKVIGQGRTGADTVRQAVEDQLYAYLNPLTWEFGRVVEAAAIKRLVLSVPGVYDLEEVRLQPDRLALGPAALPISGKHRVEVTGESGIG
ncbi:baseplate J/gp47 family protein [Actinoplanes sp. NPDC024001]|uniref:baseplate J/gp47 family protein n=1 Tax=Actinoplanes sp. NPDC024001 TaxID=3154598 RepID=UPI0033CB54C2